MCGIAGILRSGEAAVDDDAIERMTQLVAHRGPDGADVVWLSLDAGDLRAVDRGTRGWRVALGHRRLAILDLSDAGRQPMSRGDDLWLTYNGEIYNYLELRAELEKLGHGFRSQTDTEVILAAYRAWGTACFARFRGMWGILIVDGKSRRAIVCRDRLGIKPLYWRRGAGAVAIGSEIKQLRELPGTRLSPNTDALAEYLASGYEDTSRTLFTDVESLPPGTWASFDLDSLAATEPTPYWYPDRVAPSIDDPAEAGRVLIERLRESVRLHLRSDVPVGCALSGGLDSSSIAALVHQVSPRDSSGFHTFTATFPGDPVDERAFVNHVVDSISATPHFITPKPEELLDEIDRFVWIHDEPVGTASQYAAWCIARLTRQTGVPVTLNGQGGDEILAGYWQSYFAHIGGLARHGRAFPLARHFAGALGRAGNPEFLRQVPVMFRRYFARRRAGATTREKLGRILRMSEHERRVYEIRELHLPRLLKWDDRNFMAFGVEGRYPFLDHVVIEAALSFRPKALYSSGWTKEPLRRGLEGVLPKSISRRRTKLGFETPQEKWLRGALRPAIEGWLRGDSPLWPHVDRARVGRLAVDAWSREPSDDAAHGLFRHFLADRWLRAFGSEPRRETGRSTAT